MINIKEIKEKPISELTEKEISIRIAEASGEWSEGYLERNPDNAPNFLEDMNELMPLIFKHNINFYQSTSMGLRTGNFYAVDVFDKHEAMKFEDPKRALAECLLKVLEDSE